VLIRSKPGSALDLDFVSSPGPHYDGFGHHRAPPCHGGVDEPRRLREHDVERQGNPATISHPGRRSRHGCREVSPIWPRSDCDLRHNRLLGSEVAASTHVARPHMGQRAGSWLTTAPYPQPSQRISRRRVPSSRQVWRDTALERSCARTSATLRSNSVCAFTRLLSSRLLASRVASVQRYRHEVAAPSHERRDLILQSANPAMASAEGRLPTARLMRD
jgi:hypothetical protein